MTEAYDPPCQMKEDGWCARHQRYHVGVQKEKALRDDAVGATWRRHWDQRPPLPFELAPVKDAAKSPARKSHWEFRLGDLVEKGLAKVGITKDRVSSWLGAPCGCAERQRKLNALSQWAQQAAGGAAETAREGLTKLISV